MLDRRMFRRATRMKKRGNQSRYPHAHCYTTPPKPFLPRSPQHAGLPRTLYPVLLTTQAREIPGSSRRDEPHNRDDLDWEWPEKCARGSACIQNQPTPVTKTTGMENVTDRVEDNEAEGPHTGEPGWTPEPSQPIPEDKLDGPDLTL